MIQVVFDIFRSHDLGGWAKALWAIFVIVIPWLGVLIYLIARGDKMRQHAIADAEARNNQVRSYVRDAAGAPSTAEEISKLASLREQGRADRRRVPGPEDEAPDGLTGRQLGRRRRVTTRCCTRQPAGVLTTSS